MVTFADNVEQTLMSLWKIKLKQNCIVYFKIINLLFFLGLKKQFLIQRKIRSGRDTDRTRQPPIRRMNTNINIRHDIVYDENM